VTALDLVRAARRHLTAVLLCLAVTCAATAFVYLKVPVHYVSTSQLVILAPATQTVDGKSQPINPFLLAGDQASQVTASALAAVASSPSFGADLKTRGLNATSKPAIAVATAGGGVVLDISMDNVDGAVASHDLEILSTLISDTLKDRQVQAGSPANQLFTIRDLVGESPPTSLSSDRSKLTGISFGLGLVLTILVVVVLEGRRRRQETLARQRKIAELGGGGAVERAEAKAAVAASTSVSGTPAPQKPVPKPAMASNGRPTNGTPTRRPEDGRQPERVNGNGFHDNAFDDGAADLTETVRNYRPVRREPPARQPDSRPQDGPRQTDPARSEPSRPDAARQPETSRPQGPAWPGQSKRPTGS
jgi:hypothetical protein